MDVRQFVDIEADVVEDEELSTDGEEDLDSSFITNDNNSDEGDHRHDYNSRIEGFDLFRHGSTSDEARELEQIANSFKMRTPSPSSNLNSSRADVDDYDIPLWEIGVPPGKEIVYARRLRRSPLIEKRVRRSSISAQLSRERNRGRYNEVAQPGHIHNVFAVPLLSGRVFIRSRDRAEVFRRLETLKNNSFKQPILVPPSEVTQILQMRRRKEAIQPTISSGMWVRVSQGLYDGDIGLVRRVHINEREDVDRYDILVVPRVFPGESEPDMEAHDAPESRPHPCLFKLSDARKRKDGGDVYGTNEEFTFAGEKFWHSLHIISKRKSECSLIQLPSAHELEHFSSVHVNTLAATNSTFLRVTDRVRVIKGTFQGCRGTVESLGAKYATLLMESAHDSVDSVFRDEVAYDEFERIFEVGDMVEIMLGPHAGKTGMIVSFSSDGLEVECGRTSEQIAVPEEILSYEVVDSVLPAFVKTCVENRTRALINPTSSANHIQIGKPVIVLEGNAKGIGDLYSYDEKEVVVFFPGGRGLEKAEPRFVISGDWLLNGQEPCTFDGQKIKGQNRRELVERVRNYIKYRPQASAERLHGWDTRIGQPVWIFKGERKGVAELQALGKDRALVYFPGRIQALSEILLDSAISSVNWRRLDDTEIDPEASDIARQAVREFMGLSESNHETHTDAGTECDEPVTTTESPALLYDAGKEVDLSHIEWVLDPAFPALLHDYSVLFRMKRIQGSVKCWNTPVRTLVDSMPFSKTINDAGIVKNVPFIRVKYKASSSSADTEEDIQLSDLVVHEPRLKNIAVGIRGKRRGELLLVHHLDPDDRTVCWCKPLKSNLRHKRFSVPLSDVTKVEPHAK